MKRILLMLPLVSGLVGCASQPMPTVEHVDLPRFMGDWFVIAHIPAMVEKDAFDEVESYELRDDGAINTTLRFRKGSFDGPIKVYRPTGFIHDEQSNAEWRMQFIWPFRSEYLVIYLDDSYQFTIIGRSKRDYVWLMARTPDIETAQYNMLVAFIAEQGYDISRLRRVPQSGRPIADRFDRSAD